jgi:hypothetical protein
MELEEGGKEKETDRASTILYNNTICEGRRYKDMY